MECTVKFGSCRQSWARYYKIWNKCLKIEIVYKGENAHMIIPSWLKKNLCPQRLKKVHVVKKIWMKLNSKWTIRVKGNMYTDVNIQWYSELMKTKKNNACPLIKEIEEHDDVSSEKKK